MPSEVRVAILGCGKQAPKHIKGLRSVPGVEIVLADVRPEFARKLGEQENLRWVEDLEEVFADPGIQAVDICTPTPSHPELILSALSNGKDFFCEKPLSDSPAVAREIAEVARQSNNIGMVGYVYRFAPVFELGKRLFENVPSTGISSALGPVRLAHLRIGGRGSHQLWKHRRATGGGAANEMLVHMLDLALWYFGPVRKAQLLEKKLIRPQREIGGRMEEVDAEDYILVELKMESGVTVICQADLLTPAFTQFVEVQGDNGSFMGSIDRDMPSFVFLNHEAEGWNQGRTNLQFDFTNLFEAQMSAFIHAVRTRSAPTRCTLEDSVTLLEVMEELLEEPVGA